MFESQVFIVKYSQSKQSASVILEHTLYPWGGMTPLRQLLATSAEHVANLRSKFT
jgi:hypothetical protein